MNERNTFADTSIYGCGCVINNFELPRQAFEYYSIIKFEDERMNFPFRVFE